MSDQVTLTVLQSLAADIGITEHPNTNAIAIANDILSYWKVAQELIKEKNDLLTQANNEIKALKEQIAAQEATISKPMLTEDSPEYGEAWGVQNQEAQHGK